MKRAVHPVLREVGQHQNQHELEYERQSGNHVLHTRGGGPLKKHHRRLHRQECRDLKQQRAEKEVREIGANAGFFPLLERIVVQRDRAVEVSRIRVASSPSGTNIGSRHAGV